MVRSSRRIVLVQSSQDEPTVPKIAVTPGRPIEKARPFYESKLEPASLHEPLDHGPAGTKEFNRYLCMSRTSCGGKRSECSLRTDPNNDLCDQQYGGATSGLTHAGLDCPIPADERLEPGTAQGVSQLVPRRERKSGSMWNGSRSARRVTHPLCQRNEIPLERARQSSNARDTLLGSSSDCFTPQTIDRDLCMSRVWGGGKGLQCTRIPVLGSELCAQHSKEAASSNGLSHGRVDGTVPAKKLIEFYNNRAHLPCKRKQPMMINPEALDDKNLVSVSGGVAESPGFQKVPRPLAYYNQELCMARVWANGRGAQCSRMPVCTFEFCKLHNVQAKSAKGLAHGRIDGQVPWEKISDFVNSKPEVAMSDYDSDAEYADSVDYDDSDDHDEKEDKVNFADDRGLISGGVRQRGGCLKVPRPQTCFNREHCMARVWANGRGAQCSRLPVGTFDFCKLHGEQAKSAKGLAHGRIDGEVPQEKVSDFLNAKPEMGVSDCDSDANHVDSDDCDYASVVCHVMPTRCSRGHIAALHEDLRFLILVMLGQSCIFCIASTCYSLYQVACCPRLFGHLHFRSVGYSKSFCGRARWLTHDARIQACVALLTQPRFKMVRDLDFRGIQVQVVADREGTALHTLLRLAVRQCPLVETVRLDLGASFVEARRLPSVLERCLRRLFRLPLQVEVSGRWHELR